MPASQMFPSNRQLRRVIVDLEDLTLDCTAGVRLDLKVEFSDGHKATIVSRVIPDELLSALPGQVEELVRFFLYGEGAKPVLAWAQRIDHTAMSRHVRSTL